MLQWSHNQIKNGSFYKSLTIGLICLFMMGCREEAQNEHAVDEPVVLTRNELIQHYHELISWAEDPVTRNDWETYIDLARTIQASDTGIVAQSLREFSNDAIYSDPDQARVNVLMRVIFKLPEKVHKSNFRSFSGWTNWPPPDEYDSLLFAFPVSWANGYPEITHSYTGLMGLPYRAHAEYRYFLLNYPYRVLDQKISPP